MPAPMLRPWLICALAPAAALAAAAAPTSTKAPSAGSAETEARYSDKFVECTRDAMATADTIFCIVTEAVRQEPRLEQAFEAALERLPARRRAALRAAQADWRDKALANCADEAASVAFDQVGDATRGRCMLEAMVRRTIELERIR